MPRWSEDITMKFIEMYRDRPCLWNQNDKQYRCKRVKERALMEIIGAMNINDFGKHEARYKIKNLRSTYCQEIAKIRESKKKAEINPNHHVYVPNVRWFSMMHDMFSNSKITSANVFLNDCAEMDVTDDQFDNTTSNNYTIRKFEFLEAPGSEQSSVVNYDPSLQQSAIEIPKNFDILTNSIKELKTQQEKNNQVLSNSTKEVKNLQETIHRTNQHNEFDIFGRHVTMQLQKLSIKESIIAQEQIQTILTRCRMNDLNVAI